MLRTGTSWIAVVQRGRNFSRLNKQLQATIVVFQQGKRKVQTLWVPFVLHKTQWEDWRWCIRAALHVTLATAIKYLPGTYFWETITLHAHGNPKVTRNRTKWLFISKNLDDTVKIYLYTRYATYYTNTMIMRFSKNPSNLERWILNKIAW